MANAPAEPIDNDPIHKASMQSRMEEMATRGYIVTLEVTPVNGTQGTA